ncbi:MAG: DUF2341 domain-containing protein [Patescibacteria group bacterium]
MDNRPVDIQSLDEQLAAIQRSTRTTLPALLPAHEWLRANSRLYYRWHAQSYAEPIHKLTAWGVVALSVVKIAAIVVPLVSSPGSSLAASSWTQASQVEFLTGTTAGAATVTNLNGGAVTLNSSQFSHKRSVTIDNTNGGTLTDAPVRVELTSENFDFTAAQADGDDIRFYAADDTTALEYWTESWNANDQVATVWVKLPSLNAGASTIVHLYSGNPVIEGGSAAPFSVTPSTANMSLWLDSSTLSQVDGAAVANWSDRRGLAAEATQLIEQHQPTVQTNELNGHAVVRFDGLDDFVSFGNIDDIRTVFWVYKYNPEAGAAHRPMLGHSAVHHFHGDSAQNIWGEDSSSYVTSGTTRLHGASIDGLSTQLPTSFKYMSLVTTDNTSADSFAKDRDTGNMFSGDLAELIIYNAALSDSDVKSIESYLNGKYFSVVTVGEATTLDLGGTYTSSSHDTAQFSDFSTLSWNAVVPTGTEIKFQLRSAESEADLTNATWYGPTGTNDYYVTPDTVVNEISNGKRWVQYQVTLSAVENGTFPVLESVTLAYDTASLIVTEPTGLAMGVYTVNNLTINGGQTLTLAGGTTLNVFGDLVLDDAGGASQIVCQGSNKAERIDGEWVGRGCVVNVAGDTVIDANSAITADGQGYTGTHRGAGNGPGGAPAGGIYAGPGGSYGGVGSYGREDGTDGLPGQSYGDALEPIDLGSAGGSSTSMYSSGVGGSGGGAIRLDVQGTIELNGEISANGEDGTGSGTYGSGGGSGGSIWITAGTLTGGGTIAANGGDGRDGDWDGGGGGGRIAIHYTTNNGFDFTNVTATLGGGGLNAGENGTTYALANGHLLVWQRLAVEGGRSLSYSSVLIENGSLFVVGGDSSLTISEDLTVTGGSTLQLEGANRTGKVDDQWRGTGVAINAGDLVIDAGSSITADGQGYTGTHRGAGNGPGGAPAGGIYAGPGGSYGGVGSYGREDGTDGLPGQSYGDALEPIDLGSAGGSSTSMYSSGVGGSGGGAIRLDVQGTIELNGEISANGEDGTGSGTYGSGGGSGGSIWITAGTLTGGGTIAANGGDGRDGDWDGGGGGGRIAIHYTTNNGFDFTNVTATLGGGGLNAGENGTTYALANGHLLVWQRLAVEGGRSLSYSSVLIENGSLFVVGGDSLLTISEDLTVTGGSTLQLEGANRTGKVDDQWRGTGGVINAGDLVIDAGSSITADGQGYTGVCHGAPNGPGGATVGGFHAGPGGSYGSLGKYGNANGADGTPGQTYGNAYAPIDLGSAGGGLSSTGGCGIGGSGGGAIRLYVQGTLELNGEITANGSNGAGGGGGSGGSIWITTGTLTGSGSVAANGGNGDPANSANGGGGGGRIAIGYEERVSDSTTRSAVCGAGGWTTGSQGTIVFGALPQVNLTTEDGAIMPARPTLSFSASHPEGRQLYMSIQYVARVGADCSEDDFSAAETIDSAAMSEGWSSDGLYETTSGPAAASYTFTDDLGSGYYCWRATSRVSIDGYTEWARWSAPLSYVVDAAQPAAVVLFTDFDMYYTDSSAIPTSLTGTSVDDDQGMGLYANSSTFAVSRAHDGKYWDGTDWASRPVYLSTTHPATESTHQAITWNSAVQLPNWEEGVYTIRVRAIDKAGNMLTIPAAGFTYDETPPDDIEEVRDGDDEIDDDFTATTSELAANWVETNDATAGLERYEYAVGTTDGGSDVLGWTSNATNVTMTVEGLSLAEGEQYYVATRAIDRAGNITSISSSDGIVPDVTPPTAVPVVDEQKTGTDNGLVNSTTTLSLTWEAATDAISGIQKYQYALGTTPGATDVVTWTDSTAQIASVSRTAGSIGVANAATTYEQSVTGLSLSNGTTYFASVRAVDNAGNASAPKSTDGVTVDTTAPDAPVITSPAAGATVTDSTPVITGTAEANSIVEVRVNGRTYTAAADVNGGWAVEATDPLTAGVQNDLVVRAIDGAGNASVRAERKFVYQVIAQGMIIDYPEDESVVLDPVTGMTIPVDERSLAPRIALQVRGVTFSLGDPRVAELFRGDDVTVIVTTPLGKTTTGVRIDIAGVVYELTLQDDGTYRRTLTSTEIGDATTAIVTLTYADGMTEQLAMALLINPYGYVYALDREGREIRVKDAAVRLEVQGEDGWQLWDASRFGQVNPQQTTQQGEYAFVVPAGTYQLVVTATGYRGYWSEPLVVLGEPINLNVRLVEQGAIEQFLTGLIGTGRESAVGQLVVQPAAQTANAVAVSFVALVTLGLALAPTLVAGASIAPALAMAGTAGAGVGASGAGIGAAGAAGSGAVSPLTSLIFAITSWFRRHRRYGRVYDAATNMPVAGATIRLISEGACGIESGKLIGTQVTNTLGYYHIYAAKGAYRIEVIAPNYAFPSKVALFGYKGEVKSLPSGGLLNPDVPLDGRTKQNADVLANLRSVADRIRNARLLFLVLGTIVALAFTVLAPSWLSGAVLAVYGMLWLNDLWTVARARRRALVLSDGKPVWLAIVRVYNEAKELVATCSTDNHGQFSVLLAPGNYAIEVMQSGHKLLRKTVQQPTHGDLKVTLRV